MDSIQAQDQWALVLMLNYRILIIMKNILNKSILMLLTTIVVVGCTKDFESINADPNNVSNVPPAYLTTNAQRGVMEQRFNFTGMLYAQQFSETQYTNTSRYETAEASFNNFYSGPLADFQQVINLNTDEATKDAALASGSNENQIAMARIMKVYTFQLITDMWGNIPYMEALQGAEAFKPVYNNQQDIYAHFVTELTEAAAMIDVSGSIVGDIIYDGDMGAWKKFANALKARVGIRMGNQAAVESGLAGGFTSNADDALFAYLADANNDNPIWAHFITRTDYAISEVMVNYMTTLGGVTDPRLAVYADPAENSGLIVGMPYGESESIAGSITNADISFPGSAVRQAETPGILMSYSEMMFIQAEAASNGWSVPGTAASNYDAGIQASMDYYSVDAADAATYIAANPYVNIESIGNQKWICLYTNGHEAWSEWRRLDFPVLVKAPAAVEGREIPRRRAYTQREYDLNGVNLKAALDNQGADVMDTRVWWDK